MALTDYTPSTSGSNTNVAVVPSTSATFDPYPIYITNDELNVALANYSGGSGTGAPAFVVVATTTATSGTLTANQFQPVNATANATFSLPTSASDGARVGVKNLNGSSQTPANTGVTVSITGNINGNSNATLVLRYLDQSKTFTYSASNSTWVITSGDLSVPTLPFVTSVAGKTGAVTLSVSDVTGSVKSVNNTTPDANGNISIATGSGGTAVSDATSTAKGIIQLSGDLGGTANSPTVPGLANKLNANDPTTTNSRTPTGAAGGILSGTYPNPTYAVQPVTKVNGNAPDSSGNVTVSTSGGTAVSDASTTAKGIIQLAGDLGGTAAAPTVPGLANKVTAAQAAAAAPVQSVAGRTGSVTLSNTDISGLGTAATQNSTAFDAAGAATAAVAPAVIVVNHGSTAGTARPTGYGRVDWVGTVAPTNAVAGDRWTDITTSTAPIVKICTSANTFYIAPTGSGGSTTPRVTSVPYSATVTPNGDTTDILNIGALTGNITIANPTGTPFDGQSLRFRELQDVTGGHTTTFGSAYVFGTDIPASAIPVTSPTRTDSATVTSGSSTISDATITAADAGRLVTGTGIPTNSYVGTINAGTSFVLSSSSTSNTPVNATASATTVTITVPSKWEVLAQYNAADAKWRIVGLVRGF